MGHALHKCLQGINVTRVLKASYKLKLKIMAKKIVKPKTLQALDWKAPKRDNHTRFVCISGMYIFLLGCWVNSQRGGSLPHQTCFSSSF